MRSRWAVVAAAGMIATGLLAVPAAGDPLPAGRFPQTITVAPISDVTVDQVVAVDATATSRLPVDVTVSGVCQLQDVPGGQVILATSVGVCTVRATQAGDDRWLPADPVEQSFSFFGGQAGSMIVNLGPDTYLAAQGLPLSIPLKVSGDDPEGRVPSGNVVVGFLARDGAPACASCQSQTLPIGPDGAVTFTVPGDVTAGMTPAQYAVSVSYPGDAFYSKTELILPNVLIVPPGRMITGDGPIVVSIGDSYISGEGARWAGNALSVLTAWRTDAGEGIYDDAGNPDAIKDCHRSDVAEIHIEQAGADVISVNLACSGAQTSTMFYPNGALPGIDFYQDEAANRRGQAVELYRLASANPGRIKMVVLSIGGNDFKFGTIVKECVIAFGAGHDACSTQDDLKKLFQDANIALQQGKVRDAVLRVNDAMVEAGYTADQWTLLQQGYPSPIPGDAKDLRYGERYNRALVGGCGLYNVDLAFANGVALKTINTSVELAGSLSGLPNVKFLDLTNAYVGNRLCEKTVDLVGPQYPVKNWKDSNALLNSEWVTAIRVTPFMHDAKPYMLQETLHPGYWGQLANQVCVKLAWNSGDVRGGTCVRGEGAYDQVAGTDRQYPVMTLVSGES